MKPSERINEILALASKDKTIGDLDFHINNLYKQINAIVVYLDEKHNDR